jgi:dihydropteroate synthase
MGILNVTPIPFPTAANSSARVRHGAGGADDQADGVDMIDIGGESTRPGAPSVPLQEELRTASCRSLRIARAAASLSIDTCKPEVMREAIIAGADMINDINGFRAPGAVEAVADSDCGLCIMHMQGTPQTCSRRRIYTDVVERGDDFLRERVDAMAGGRCCAGAHLRSIRDLALARRSSIIRLASMPILAASCSANWALPVLAGVSRKSMIGALTGRPVDSAGRQPGGRLAAVAHGARIVRVHDVAETVDALKVWQAAASGVEVTTGIRERWHANILVPTACVAWWAWRRSRRIS